MANGASGSRFNYVPNAKTPQGTCRRLLTVLRTVADIAKIFNCHGVQGSGDLRGKEGDVAFAEWIIDQLNIPADQRPVGTVPEFTVNTQYPRAGTAARVNYLSNIDDSARNAGIADGIANVVADIAKDLQLSPSRKRLCSAAT